MVFPDAVTSSSASASSSFEYSRLPHDSFPLFVEPRNNFIDGGFLEGVGALDYRPDFATSGSTDFLEGFPGTVLSDPEDSTLFPDTLPHRKTRKTVASAARIRFSEKRRKNPARFSCWLCDQTFTTKINLKSKLSSADVVAHELINIFQTIRMLTWALRLIVVIGVRGHLVLRLLSGDILKLVKRRRNLCNNQAEMKMIPSLKFKDICPSVATSRPSGMFPAICRTIPSSTLPLSSALLAPSTPLAEASSAFSTSITRLSIQFLSTSCCYDSAFSGARHPHLGSSCICLVFCSVVMASFVSSDSLPPSRNLSSGRIYP